MPKKPTAEEILKEQIGEEIRGEDNGRWLIGRLIESGIHALASGLDDTERSGIRRPLAIPKEMIGTLVNRLDSTKSEVVALFGREFKRFLEATDLSEEVTKALSQMTIEVKAEISFNQKDEKTGKSKRTSKRKVTIKGS